LAHRCHPVAVAVGRRRLLHQLEGPRVAGLLLRASHSPLVSCGGRAGVLSNEIYCWAIWLEPYGEGRATVVL